MELLHATARLTVDWMVYCLIEGTLLALFVWLLLRLLPRQNAGTRFALWFSALSVMIVLPFLRGGLPNSGPISGPSIANAHGLLTLPASWALYIFSAWAIIVTAALARVALGLWQVRGLRKRSQEIDPGSLHPLVQQMMQEFPGVSLRVSDQVRVPAAVGFFAPAIIVPNWFLPEMSAEELRHVLRHEMAHLRRGDGWSNLAQKVIKAVLFFHPSAWWIEQQISLEREIACDDAVLAQAATPQEYAQCLKHVAEKSFLRRKLALAQGVVSAMRQLSLRMARILDADRPGTTRLWKPAVPIVVTLACLCGFSARTAPELVSFTSDQPLASASVANSSPSAIAAAEVKADLLSSSPQPKLVLANASLDKVPVASRSTRKTAPRKSTPHPVQAKAFRDGDYVIQSEQVIVTMTSDGVDAAGQPVWQVHLWQVRVLAPASTKTTSSRKNI